MDVIRVARYEIAGRGFRFVGLLSISCLSIVGIHTLLMLKPDLFTSVEPFFVASQIMKAAVLVFVLLTMRDVIGGVTEARLVRLPVSLSTIRLARQMPSLIFSLCMTILFWFASYVFPGADREIERLITRSDTMILTLFWLPIVSDLLSIGVATSTRWLRRVAVYAAFLSIAIPIGFAHFILAFDWTLVLAVLAIGWVGRFTMEGRPSYRKFAAMRA